MLLKLGWRKRRGGERRVEGERVAGQGEGDTLESRYKGPHLPFLSVTWGRGEWGRVGRGQDYADPFINMRDGPDSRHRPLELTFQPQRLMAGPAN